MRKERKTVVQLFLGHSFYFVSENEEDEELTTLIEDNGGKVLDNQEEEKDIILLSSDAVSDTPNVVSTQFIRECVSKQKFLDFTQYYVPTKKKRGRISYDDKIMQHIQKELASGKKINDYLFQKMAKEKVVDLPWKTIKEKYEALTESRQKRQKIERPDSHEEKNDDESNPLGSDDQQVVKKLGAESHKSGEEEEEEEGDDDSQVSRPSAQAANDASDHDLSEVSEAEEHEGKSKENNNQKEQDPNYEEKVKWAIDTLEQISEQPRVVVLYALYVASGDVSVAKQFLLKGPKAVGNKIWTAEEDEICRSKKKTQPYRNLVEAKGEEAVKNRAQFIKECEGASS